MDPKIDGENIARSIKSTVEKIPIIALEQGIGGRCPFADHHIPSDDRQALLELARSLLGGSAPVGCGKFGILDGLSR